MTSRWKTYGISHRIMLTNQQNTAILSRKKKKQSQVCLQQKAAARYGHLWSSFSKRARWSCAKKCSWRKISVTWAKATARCHARGFSKKGGSFCLGTNRGFCGWFLWVLWLVFQMWNFGIVSEIFGFLLVSGCLISWTSFHMSFLHGSINIWTILLCEIKFFKLSTIPIFESIWGAFSNFFHSGPPPNRHGEQPPPARRGTTVSSNVPRFASVWMKFSTSEGGMGVFFLNQLIEA